jgi:hypothetical protein
MHGLRPQTTQAWQRFFSYDRGMILSGVGVLAGLSLLVPFLVGYVEHGFRLSGLSHTAILGLLSILLGFQTFAFTLLLEMARRVIGPATQ